MKAVTSGEMSSIDRKTIDELSVPGEILMNNAGKYVADYILSETDYGSFLVFCGKGNNGGDGFAAAYYLWARSKKVKVVLTSSPSEISSTSGTFYKMCLASGIDMVDVDALSIVDIDTDNVLIVDSVFGTGFKGVPHGSALRAIELMNSSKCPVLAVDLPSGLESDGAVKHNSIVKALWTVTIGLPKISLVTYPGKNYTGRLEIADIGFPSFLLNSSVFKTELIDSVFAKSVLESSLSGNADIHKGDRGHCAIIGGFPSMEGAGLLCANGMFSAGIGLVTLFTPEESRRIIAGRIPELMTFSIDSSSMKDFTEYVKCRKIRHLVIGPGMGRSEGSQKIFNYVIEHLESMDLKSVVIDGDGLYYYSKIFRNKKTGTGCSIILTPHLFEASRFFEGEALDEISKDRYSYAVELSRITRTLVLLKGPCSICTDGERVLVNTSGNSGMATAGSGDVLSGIISSMMCRYTENELHALASAVFVHGLAGDLAYDKFSFDCFSSGSISEHTGAAIKKILNG